MVPVDDGRGGVDGDGEEAEELAVPVAGFEVDEAGVGGVGVLGHAAAAEPVEDVLGHGDPGGVGVDGAAGGVGQSW
jgi:hypothetical protein